MTEHAARGRLIVFEGPDGVGKSTLSKQLAGRLLDAGVPCEHLAFPGEQPGSLGRLVYDLHHDAQGLGLGDVNPTSLQILHIAAHVDAIEKQILPALRDGIWVILDRFWWSTWVYGTAFEVPQRSLEAMVGLERLHWGQVEPYVIFLLEREKSIRGVGDGLTGQLTDGYRELATQEQLNSRVVTLDNDASLEDVLDTAWAAIAPVAPQPSERRDFSRDAQLRLPEDPIRPWLRLSRLSPARPTMVYDTYWRFAVERQEMFFRRIEGYPPPWTEDTILARHKFTNAYRASDRVSQYLIRNVIYEGPQSREEVFFRTLLFKLFNKIETWELLESSIGEIQYSSYSFDAYDRVLSRARAEGHTIYSAAYIIPSAGRAFGYTQKHRNHLKLIERMMEDELPGQIADARTMREAFALLRSYPSIGDFLAYQFVTDLNYGEFIDFSEMEFVVPGPGAIDGIRKCFSELGGLTEQDLIRVVTERQEEEFDRLGLRFRDLWGRRLQLIDCQNLFCEVSKYARVKHPDVNGVSSRSRIKQVYRPTADPLKYWYPPKWGINPSIPITGDSA